MKLAISVWLWRRRLLLFVFLASLKLSLGICILSQGGLWVTVSAIVAWPGCLAVLRACFGLHTIRIVFERVWWTRMTLDLPALLHSGWQSPQWLYFADVNVEKVGLLSTKIWTFWWCFRAALQNMWSLCMLVFEALRCFVFLWFKEITLFNEILLSWQIRFSERLPRCC